MKSILIDVNNSEVKEVEINDKNVLLEWYKTIGCSLVTTGCYINEHDDAIMVDDEGLLNIGKDTRFFTYEGAHQPFAGNGLVVGTSDRGKTIAPQITIEEVRSKVKFYSLNEVKELIQTL